METLVVKGLKENGRTVRNALDGSITSRRKQPEKTSMLKLKAVYPYGFNDGLGDENEREDIHLLVVRNFHL